jgi:hypothetical protein
MTNTSMIRRFYAGCDAAYLPYSAVNDAFANAF